MPSNYRAECRKQSTEQSADRVWETECRKQSAEQVQVGSLGKQVGTECRTESVECKNRVQSESWKQRSGNRVWKQSAEHGLQRVESLRQVQNRV
jgi:hypothetical protein